MERSKSFGSFFADVSGGEGDRCNYPTRLDTYGCGCFHDCRYCVDPETLVLMYDGTHKPIKDVQIGDEIYGVSEQGKYTKYVHAVVTNKHNTKKPSYRIELENGTELICSGDHRWLTNRGWKYTTGSETGEDRRPHITTSNRMIGLSHYDFKPYQENELYKEGYIAGVMEGDGSVCEYHYENGDVYQVRLAMKEYSAVKRTQQYLSGFGIETHELSFPMKDRDGNVYDTVAIRTSKQSDYRFIRDLIEQRATEPTASDVDYMRGYLSGIYDAEGTSDKYVKRVFDADDGVISYVCRCLDAFGFSYTFDKEYQPKNLVVKTVRLTGGIQESFRLMQVINPAIRSKFTLDDVPLKNPYADELKIRSITPYSDSQELVDITTTTGNFIANGCVSHNCYAKSLLDFRKNWHPDKPHVASTADISKALKKVRRGQVLRLGGMTDCFQPLEKVYGATRQAIQMMNARGIGYLIVTKSALVADKSYTRIMDPELAHIQISVTSTSDEPNFLGERASKPSDRLRAAETLQELGFDVSLRGFTVHTRTSGNRGSESLWCSQVPSGVPQGQRLHQGMA